MYGESKLKKNNFIINGINVYRAANGDPLQDTIKYRSVEPPYLWLSKTSTCR